MVSVTEDENGPVSPLHDIPLFVDQSKKIVNMVVEIPRWTNAKMEVDLLDTYLQCNLNEIIFITLDYIERNTESNQARYQER